MSTARFSTFRSPTDGIMPNFPDGLSADVIVANRIVSSASFAWDSSTSTPAAAPGYASSASVISSVHQQMRRCVMAPDGSIVGFLHPADSTKWEDGSDASSVIAGGGASLYQVMVQIPLCYYKVERIGTITIWSISDSPQAGFSIHPAFIRGDDVVEYRYIGAYDAALYDVSGTTYLDGLNSDNNTGNSTAPNVDPAADKLVSVSGRYPMVGLTRPQFRQLAGNLGSGWHLQDFWLTSLTQLLAVIEIQTFNTQAILGMGNTQTTYAAASESQSDSGHSVAGKSNAAGNYSAYLNSTARDTAWMSYRGIENWYGNCWNFVDGINTNGTTPYATSDSSAFADDTETGYTNLGFSLPGSNDYVKNVHGSNGIFLPNEVGGSSSTYITDYFWRNVGWRVALFGGKASDSSSAGGLRWSLSDGSVTRYRSVGTRLAR